MVELMEIVEGVDRFPTVDEILAFGEQLAAEHPGRVTLREIGRSRGGDPIHMLNLEVEQPRVRALVIGQPHPNEPIGMATIVALCRLFVAEPAALKITEASWHFVPCADPDGTRLNEGWFAGPWDRQHYARHFFRPGPEAQVEWTFPFSNDEFSIDKPLPETVALMAAIDEVRPQVIVSLHNAELGGAYFYVSSGDQILCSQLASLCAAHDIPLHRGELDTPLSVQFAPGIFSVPTAQDLYDMATATGVDPSTFVSGGNSLDYASRHGRTFGLAVELPFWRDARAADTRPNPDGVSRRDAVLAGLQMEESTFTRLRALYEAGLPLSPSPLQEAVVSFLQIGSSGHLAAQQEQVAQDPEYERTATVAEAFSAIDAAYMLRLRLGGMLLRALPPDAERRGEAEQFFAEWCAEAEAHDQAEPIPIPDLVAVQAGSIQAVNAHVVGR